ncbi:MAG: DNA repair protein RadA [Stomatobaculum sp.]|nr:DNA repair protein RadA [Stomatobaculum sp.]
MKKTTGFFCSECGYESVKWAGQCPACKAWNTMVEEPTGKIRPSRGNGASGGLRGSAGGLRGSAAPVSLEEIPMDGEERFSTGFAELDRVLGGGTVAGSMVLVGGDPGIGKSTILLQVCRNFAAGGKKVLYVSGEESLKQIKMRAARIGTLTGQLKFLSETNLDVIRETIDQEKPDAVVIDSIQTMYCEEIASAPGSVGQVRESTSLLMQIAKGSGIAVFIIGHVTKEGQVAGPRVLEHMVDTVLYFEGERTASYRILRAVKNRFGSTNEIGVFEMTGEGLAEVPNPSEYMLEGRPVGASGAVAACSMEGTRPILVEVQALVTETAFGMPRRTAAGIDYNRVNLLMAVLEKRCRLPLSHYDAYVNVAGGMRMNEPAMDLAVVSALISSYRDIPVEEHTLLFGEVGLSGEVRSVTMAEYRVREAAKLGFTTCILPKSCLPRVKVPEGIRCIGVASVSEVIDVLFR